MNLRLLSFDVEMEKPSTDSKFQCHNRMIKPREKTGGNFFVFYLNKRRKDERKNGCLMPYTELYLSILNEWLTLDESVRSDWLLLYIMRNS